MKCLFVSCPYSTAAAQLTVAPGLTAPRFVCLGWTATIKKEKKSTNLELRVYPVEMESTNLLGVL